MALRTNNISYTLQFSFYFFISWKYFIHSGDICILQFSLITKIKEFNIIKFLSKVLLNNRSKRRESSVVKHENPERAKFRNGIFQ